MSPPSFGWSGASKGCKSLSGKPAAFRRAAMRSAARVQLPADKVVLVSTNSLYSARKRCSPAAVSWGGAAAAAAVTANATGWAGRTHFIESSVRYEAGLDWRRRGRSWRLLDFRAPRAAAARFALAGGFLR